MPIVQPVNAATNNEKEIPNKTGIKEICHFYTINKCKFGKECRLFSVSYMSVTAPLFLTHYLIYVSLILWGTLVKT